MVRSVLLWMLAAATVQGQAPTTAPDAEAAQEKLIGTIMSECVRSPITFDFDASETTTPPPGLSRLAGFKIHRLDGPLQAFVYRDFGSSRHEGSCGIAVYGNVSGHVLNDLRALLIAMGGQKEDLYHYQIPGAAPGEQEYWSNQKRGWGSRIGLSIIERSPSTLAPTIEVHLHSIRVI